MFGPGVTSITSAVSAKAASESANGSVTGCAGERPASMRLVPVVGGAGVDLQRHVQ
jgi:hypothetical protein